MLECENAFWTFSLALYARPGVADECLLLQGNLNIDVNVLLFCAWLGAEKQVALDDAAFVAIDAQVERWHNTVVRPLRAVRQSMKSLSELSNQDAVDLRKSVGSAELRAEQIEQALLFEVADKIAQGGTAAQDAIEANVSAYLRRHGATADDVILPRRLIAEAAG